MTYELEEIKKIRKKLGLTQTELANRSNVSQSLIAKIESGRIDPTYTKTQKIFAALSDLEKKEEIKAEKLMTTRIVSVNSSDSIKESITKMKKYQISQLPVIDNHKLVGLVSESTILDALLNSKATQVKDVMQDSPPIVSKATSIQVVSNLLKHFPMVAVSEEGKLVGLITKSDLLGKLYKS
ncbi:transcriptional regulator [Candidatus Woesearchaeota archaeon]|jgi:predicted transcriptional regulator|nr:transcriptional regulator [Candidatus Woesearchaeota archaeon]MDP6648340.1 CBS domain-containing protein [Candidatus Woesearchaeota archaeon]|tara:strand:+ start:8614 stop:9159 length:546 start_codon:yes stop_codon:yes gene_type:complete